MIRDLTIQNEEGQTLVVAVTPEGRREVGRVFIDGVAYHMERMAAADLQREYRVDTDDSYNPQRDASGKCVIVAPYSSS